MESELNDLKEIAIAKIKAAYNRSIDLESTHTILWDKYEKLSKNKIIIILILSLFSTSSLFIIITLNFLIENTIFLLFISTYIIAFIILILIIWEVFIILTGKSETHGRIVTGAYQLRELSMDFLQNKLDNLDKKGYIDELKTLEIKDTKLKEKSSKFTKKLQEKTVNLINVKIDDLEKQGIKKYFITQEEIDSANKKLQKFTALRTCEAWIKFT
jgi:hypothetical protein